MIHRGSTAYAHMSYTNSITGIQHIERERGKGETERETERQRHKEKDRRQSLERQKQQLKWCSRSYPPFCPKTLLCLRENVRRKLWFCYSLVNLGPHVPLREALVDSDHLTVIVVFKDAYMSLNIAHTYKVFSSLGAKPDSKIYCNTAGKTGKQE